MFPLVFLMMACIGYAIVGSVVLICTPALRLTFLNLVTFVAGAIPGGLAFLFVYGQVLAKYQLSDAAFLGIVPALAVGGIVGGGLLVWLKTHFQEPQLDNPTRE
jgi:hypothetical protein